MPIGDWQFWVVTLVAIGALVMLWRMLLPKKKGKRTRLTISAKDAPSRPGERCDDQASGPGCSC